MHDLTYACNYDNVLVLQLCSAQDPLLEFKKL